TAGGPSAISGETLRAAPGAPLEVTVAVDAVEPRPADVRVTFVRNGSAIAAWSGSTPFRATHREVWDGRPAVFRLEARGGGARLGTRIAAVALDVDQPWGERHLRSIETAYERAPHLPAWREALARLYAQPWERLAPVAVASAEFLARATGVTAPARLASSLGVDDDDPTGRLVALCRAVGADTYLAGGHGARYMDAKRFADAGIRVLYQTYEHPVYAQQHGDFVPFLSGLDLLLMHGDESLPILRRGDAWTEEP